MAITKLIRIGTAKGNNPTKGVAATLKYISNPEKTEGGRLVCGHNCGSTWQDAYVDMDTTKEMFDKCDGSQAYHYVISFPPSEDISQDLCLVITRKFVTSYLGEDFEALYAVHTDTNHMHSHIVFNSVARTDGHKYHCDKSEWRKQIQPLVNDLCQEYGLSTIQIDRKALEKAYFPEDQKPLYQGKRLSRDEWQREKKGYKSWADFAAADIDLAIEECFSYEEVIRFLQERGWQVKWRTKDGSRELKHLSMRPAREAYRLEEESAWIRPGTRCGYGYSREGICERLEKCIFHIDEIDISEEEERRYSYRPPKVIKAYFSPRSPKYRLTDYQRKRIAYLYRTGQMARYQANHIPRECRAQVAELDRVMEEVRYMLEQNFQSRADVEAKMRRLRMLQMVYERREDGEAVGKVKHEIRVCERLMKKVKVPEMERNGLSRW